jgi:L-rhamnonate dehydratase
MSEVTSASVPERLSQTIPSAGRTIVAVEVARFSQSLWGAFWDIQKSAPSVGPMSRYPEYATSLDSWWWPQAQVLVRIVTKDGASGIGWAEDGTGAATAIIENHLKSLLIGQDAAHIDRLWDQMYRASIPYGRGGVLMHALSAIDIALWDLAGKVLGQPVHALLGGARRNSMAAYASNLQPVPIEDLVAEAKGYVTDGYLAMKMRMPGGPAAGAAGLRRNEEVITAVRDAIGGEIELMLDAYMGWDLRFARQMADIAHHHGIAFMEEPLLPDETESYADLCRYSPVTIAHGENVFSPWDFDRLIRRGAIGLVQPDLHRCGGISGFRRIAMLADIAGLELAPHAFSAPTVHVCMTLGNCRLLEHLTVPCWAADEFKAAPNLFLGEPRVVNGRVELPSGPGLGVRINGDLAPALAGWN